MCARNPVEGKGGNIQLTYIYYFIIGGSWFLLREVIVTRGPGGRSIKLELPCNIYRDAMACYTVQFSPQPNEHDKPVLLWKWGSRGNSSLLYNPGPCFYKDILSKIHGQAAEADIPWARRIEPWPRCRRRRPFSSPRCPGRGVCDRTCGCRRVPRRHPPR